MSGSGYLFRIVSLLRYLKSTPSRRLPLGFGTKRIGAPYGDSLSAILPSARIFLRYLSSLFSWWADIG